VLLKVSLFERGSWCKRLSLLVCSHCFSATQKIVDDVCFILQKYAISGVALMPNLGVCGFSICYFLYVMCCLVRVVRVCFGCIGSFFVRHDFCGGLMRLLFWHKAVAVVGSVYGLLAVPALCHALFHSWWDLATPHGMPRCGMWLVFVSSSLRRRWFPLRGLPFGTAVGCGAQCVQTPVDVCCSY